MSTDLVATMRMIFDAAKVGPRPFDALRERAEVIFETDIHLSLSEAVEALMGEGEGGQLHALFREHLARWDHIEAADWANGTPPNSASRRAALYDALQIEESMRGAFDDQVPFLEAEKPTVIAAKNWDRWYTPDRRAARHFYWDAVASHLRDTERWSEQSIISLDEASTSVVERLANPTAEEAYQSKGLVVGYVQSGKTANITGVVAKAADAGYRLIIVLAGTQNMLRNQTQRRLDRELVGAEFLEDEYDDAADWDQFLRHGDRPSLLGAFDWVRLTTRSRDYRKLPAGAIETLKFGKRHPDRRLNHPDNLHRLPAKLLVVKKNATVLDKLRTDLQRANSDGLLIDIPALVIDDESDQASVNTVRPSSIDDEEKIERTRINAAIVHLLEILPRAQYVGYTATPFANVFIDPADAEDLFPRDFIVALGRPPDYLGASDFHDLDGPPSETATDPFRSNEHAYVRPVFDDDPSNEQLRTAIDTFVLTGAIKLFRGVALQKTFRHHTMIVHTSQRIADHQEQFQAVRDIVDDAGYESGAARERLAGLLETDLLPVSRSRAPELPMPTSLDDLEDELGETLSRLHHGGTPALVVNSTGEAHRLAFDAAEPVWKIIVGGAKLSRGFTVEGLTVSYFRRRSPTADTLMQMGRWCGFRRGYADLVRLYIARSRPDEADVFDTYEAFEGICRDEESFRGELKRYALPENDDELITPRDIPPLVASHLDWIKPTSRNKMYNAGISFRNFGGMLREHRLTPDTDSDVRHNERIARQVLEAHELVQRELVVDESNVRAYVAHAARETVEDFLRSYRWLDDRGILAPELEFLSGKGGEPCVDDWIIVVPQLQQGAFGLSWSVSDHPLTVHSRKRNPDTRLVNAYAGPDDRRVAATLAGVYESVGVSHELAALSGKRHAVLLVYPIVHGRSQHRDWVPTMGITLMFPRNQIRRQIGFVVKDNARADEPVVLIAS